MRERLALALYATLWIVVTPFVALYLLWRSRRQPAYRLHWRERFLGRYAGAALRDCVWIHAVSVGETRAAAPLVDALRARHPDVPLLVTHMTPTGRDTAQVLFGDTVAHAYLAYDRRFALTRFVGHWRPRLGIVMETEIWPGLMDVACRTSLPLVLANARLSERSLRSALRWTSLLRPAARTFACIVAQTGGDAERFALLTDRAFDDRITIAGNMKFDIAVPDAQRTLAAHFRRQRGEGRGAFLCASTRDGEERAIVAAWQAAIARIDPSTVRPLLVIVPRHPQRFDEVAAVVRAQGLVVQRRSGDEDIDAQTDVWIGDSMGELFAYYLAVDAAYIGGSIAPLGGQNLIEAAAAGCPMLIGVHTFNFKDAAEGAVSAGAAARVETFDALAREGLALLADEPRRRTMAEAGIAFAAAHRGATERTLAVVERLLAERPALLK